MLSLCLLDVHRIRLLGMRPGVISHHRLAPAACHLNGWLLLYTSHSVLVHPPLPCTWAPAALALPAPQVLAITLDLRLAVHHTSSSSVLVALHLALALLLSLSLLTRLQLPVRLLSGTVHT